MKTFNSPKAHQTTKGVSYARLTLLKFTSPEEFKDMITPVLIPKSQVRPTGKSEHESSVSNYI